MVLNATHVGAYGAELWRVENSKRMYTMPHVYQNTKMCPQSKRGMQSGNQP